MRLPFREVSDEEGFGVILLGFLVLRTLQPRRILQAGTATGNSYLSLCQAVRTYGLSTQCFCVPRPKPLLGVQQAELAAEFRAQHDLQYSDFSHIGDPGLKLTPIASPHDFDLVHLIDPGGTSDELEDLCATWLPRLSPSGVGLISGAGPFNSSTASESRTLKQGRWCARVSQLDGWVLMLSRQPIGLVRDLLLSPQDEFRAILELFTSTIQRLRAEQRSTLAESAIQVERIRKHLAETSESLEQSRKAEMDAQIRFGNTELRLEQMWSEREELRRQLELNPGANRQLAVEITQSSEQNQSGRADEGATQLLRGIWQRYSGEAPPQFPLGRSSWDDCGERVLQSILAGAVPLTFPRPALPDISVALVLKDKAHLTVLCLCALLAETRANYELIVIDNCSSDKTSQLLAQLEGATVIRNAHNVGFGAGVAQAIRYASGKYICLLNNDALLSPGALHSVVGIFEEEPDVGVVGGKVILSNGRLQEAGCLVWRDGRAKQYGREDDSSLPQYNFRRPVDYCSGVFLVTPRLLFEELGGLDLHYAPAYYEDTDYCMKVWERKQRVIYEPRAIVYHYEGASSSLPQSRGLLVRNHLLFTERWRTILERHQADSPGNLFRARIAASSGLRTCLYVPAESSSPSSDADMISTVKALLRDGYVVSLVSRSGEQNVLFGAMPPTVEIIDSGILTADELDKRCKGSDLIVLGDSSNLEPSFDAIFNKYTDKRLPTYRALDRRWFWKGWKT
jgi:GT2 family glycosyltransferase